MISFRPPFPMARRSMLRVFAALPVLALAITCSLALTPSLSAQSNEILPVSQIQPGMQGYAYTIFAGDQVEKFDLEEIGRAHV